MVKYTEIKVPDKLLVPVCLRNECYVSVVHLDLYSFLVIQKPGNRPGEVNLGGAIVEWTKEKSSRKNVIQVRREHSLEGSA